MAVPAGTRCSRESLRRIYERQFRETSALRRRILSLLPLSSVESIFEPGCGTGLLGRQIMSLTATPYLGMDIDPGILPEGESFQCGDAVRESPPAGLYVSSFFFSSLKDPVRWLRKLRTGYYAVFCEYDYEAIREEPPGNLAEGMLQGLRNAGLHTCHGGRLDGYFSGAGYLKLYGGEMESSFQPPDMEFLESIGMGSSPGTSLVKWRIVWGIWRKRP